MVVDLLLPKLNSRKPLLLKLDAFSKKPGVLENQFWGIKKPYIRVTWGVR